MTGRPLRRLVFALLALAALAGVAWALTPPYLRHPFSLRMTVLDVGKADCLVVESPGGRVLVVDAAGFTGRGDDRARTVVAPYLRRRGIRRIDPLVLTHPHPDHIAGAATLIEQFAVGQVYDNGTVRPEDDGLVRRYVEAAQAKGVPVSPVRAGQMLEWERCLLVTVLNPVENRRAPGQSVNDTSVVLRVAYGRTAFLLTGDARAPVEDRLRESGATLRADVLKVAHHGSVRATTAPFLDAVRPAYAAISVSASNRSGHPSPETLRRLEAAGATVWRTDRHGNVTFTTDGRRITASAERGDAP
jgi:competence protein ComEC